MTILPKLGSIELIGPTILGRLVLEMVKFGVEREMTLF